MAIYFETLQQFRASGGLKATTITAKQLLPAVVAHMQRMDRSFTLQVNGRLPKSMDALLEEVFELCHLQQPFYTQHCASRNMRYKVVSKNRVKIDFTLRYRMSREEEKWVVAEIRRILRSITTNRMSAVEKVVVVHDYIIRAYDYEMQTEGSPFTVYTFMHEKQGVCMAYALLFEKMMEELDIPCYYVVGKADGEGDLGHAWNMVELDGYWYHVDATWDDLGTKRGHHEIRYRYFLRSDEVFKRDHQWNLAHYPPCVSDRFDKLSPVYDAALLDGVLYFPHPKTAQLTTVNVEKLVFKKVLDVRVQQCTMLGGQLYFSHYDNKGYLYRYDVKTKELQQQSQVKVRRITCDETQMIVVDETGESCTYMQTKETELEVKVAANEPDLIVPLVGFGDSYFGHYEGNPALIAFEAENGIRLFIQEPLKKLTVDILLHKGVEITMTTARKNVQLTTPAILTMPKVLIVNPDEIKSASGQPIEYMEQEESVDIQLLQSTTLTFG